MTVLDQPNQIKAFRLLTLRSMLRLEVRGLRKTGRSAYQIIKSEFGLKGNRKQVLEQFEKIAYEYNAKELGYEKQNMD